MIIEIPFSFRAVVTRARRRNPETLRVVDRLPVKIDEVATPPLAAVLRTAAGAEVPYHAHGGGLVTPWTSDRRPVPVDGAFERAIAEAIAQRDDSPFPAAFPVFEAAETVRLARLEVRAWHESAREEVVDRIAAEARRCVIADGLLLVPTPGPAWSITPNDQSREPQGFHLRAIRAYNFDDYPEDQFRGDRRADAENDLLRLCERTGAVAGQPKGAIEVLRPEAFTADTDGHLLRGVAREVLDGLAKQLAKAPRPVADAYLDLRDRLNQSVGYDAAAVAHLAELLETCRRTDTTFPDVPDIDAVLARLTAVPVAPAAPRSGHEVRPCVR